MAGRGRGERAGRGGRPGEGGDAGAVGRGQEYATLNIAAPRNVSTKVLFTPLQWSQSEGAEGPGVQAILLAGILRLRAKPLTQGGAPGDSGQGGRDRGMTSGRS